MPDLLYAGVAPGSIPRSNLSLVRRLERGGGGREACVSTAVYRVNVSAEANASDRVCTRANVSSDSSGIGTRRSVVLTLTLTLTLILILCSEHKPRIPCC